MCAAHVAFSKSSFVCVFFAIWIQCVNMVQYNTIPVKIVKNIIYDKTVSGQTCKLEPDDGPCRANIPMYYFDPEVGNCTRFLWGGCQGNGNRFDTHKQCINTCLKLDTRGGRPRWCSLSFDYGYCFGALKRYYYDHIWRVCKERIYSGCGGNRNNFYSFEQCEAVCRFGTGKITSTKKYTGVSKKVLIINSDNLIKKGAKSNRKVMTMNETISEPTINVDNKFFDNKNNT